MKRWVRVTRVALVTGLLAAVGVGIALSLPSKGRRSGHVVTWGPWPASDVATNERAAPAKPPASRVPPRPTVPLARIVGQMVMAGMDGIWPSTDLLHAIRAGRVGGVILFQNNDSSDLPAAIHAMQTAARAGGVPPLLIAVDQEGGSVKRLDGPPTIDTRAIQDEATASEQGQRTGSFLKRLGINVDLAPVSDVGGSSNSFIVSQDRGFSGSADRVAALVSAFARGLQESGVAATGKHFPGVGSLGVDTDNELSTVSASANEVQAGLIPFQRLADSGVDMIMVASAVYPSLDGSGLPAGFSPRIIGDLLRGRLGFHGVAITDALDSPPQLGGSPADRAVKAAKAGADIVLFAPADDGGPAYDGLLAAAESHQLSRSALNASYARIIALKQRVAR